MLSKWPRASAKDGVSRNTATRITASVAAVGANARRSRPRRDHHGCARRSAMRARTAGHMSRLGPSSRVPMSDRVRSRSVSRSRSGIGAHLARGDLAQTPERTRQARLHGPARDAERIGHLDLRELHEVAVCDDQTILLAKLPERTEYERTPLARQGRLLGRQGRVTRGAILGDAEIDRRSTAGRLAAVLCLVRDDPQQPWAERRSSAEATEREVGLGEPVLGGVFRLGGQARNHVGGPGGECLISPHQLAVRLGVSVLCAFHEYSVLRRPALHGVGSHPSYNRPAKRFPPHAVTSASSSPTRRSIAPRSARSIPSTLNCSTAKDAQTVPWRTARQSVRSSSFPACARWPSSPPANASPAPVGSRTSSSGYAGVQKIRSAVRRSAPYSARLMITARGPSASISRAALSTLCVAQNCRASASLTVTMSTRVMTSARASRRRSIQ